MNMAHGLERRVLRGGTWNICIGSGKDDNESAYLTHLDEKEVKKNLEGIARTIVDEGCDYVFLQEVDYASSRTGFMNQLEFIRKKLGSLTGSRWYGKYIRNIKFSDEYYWQVLGSFLPIGKKIYQMFHKFILPDDEIILDFGNAILSRYPIKNLQAKHFTPKNSRKGLVGDINLFRCMDERKTIMRCEIDYGSKKPLVLYGVHLDDKNPALRRKEGEMIVEKILAYDHSQYINLLGDFNSKPEGKNVPYLKRDALGLITHFGGLQAHDAVNPDVHPESVIPERYYTFPSENPVEKIDAHLPSEDLMVSGYHVVTEAKYSDHLMVVMETRIK